MGTSSKTYERLGTVPISVVLGATGGIQAHGTHVGVGGLRIRTFREKGTQCSCCGLHARYFAVERHKGATHGYHLNLWGVNEKGAEVLFTHDHTLARSLGGKDHIDNATSMCSPCNSRKSKVEGLELRKLRGEDVEMTSHERALQRMARRAEKKAKKAAEDPEYAARVAAHAHHNPKRKSRAVHTLIPT